MRQEGQGSLNSSASLDLGFLAFLNSKSEVSILLGRQSVGEGHVVGPPSFLVTVPHPSPQLAPRSQSLHLLTCYLSSPYGAPCIAWVHLLFSRFVCPYVHRMCVCGGGGWACLCVPICLVEQAVCVPVRGQVCSWRGMGCMCACVPVSLPVCVPVCMSLNVCTCLLPTPALN